jgi:polysaccharide biosynthesis/export protein
MKRLLLIAVVFTLTSIAQAGPLEYRIGVDDVLDVGVWNVAEMQKTVAVRSDGKISFPLVNDVVAAGLTPMELRKVLTEKIATFVHAPDVSVVVREIHSQKVSVLGQVHAPGRYDIKGPSTVLDALAMAGGFTDFASRRNIAILRNTGAATERLQFDYDQAVSRRGAGKNNIVMQPGDIIVVP